MTEYFAGFPYRKLTGPVWKVGAPNSRAIGHKAVNAVSTRCLEEGATYEVEATVGPEGPAVQAAAASDTLLAYKQLAPPVQVELLLERSVRVSRIDPVEVPVLDATGPERKWLGLKPHRGAPIHEDVEPLRRAVRHLRSARGKGAILLPGIIEGVSTVIVPRRFLTGQLRIEETGKRGIPRDVVAYALGVRLFPDPHKSSNGNLG